MRISGLWLVPILWCLSTGASSNDYSAQKARFIEQLTPAEKRWVDTDEPLVYVYDPDWPPFEWKAEFGGHRGIIADLFALLSEKTGLYFIPRNTNTWADSVELVKNGGASMFSAITVTNERKQYLNFTTQDIYTYPAVLLTQFDDKQVYLQLDKDAQHKTIAIVKASGLGEYVRKGYPELKYIEVESTQKGFDAVATGSADLFAINAISARYFIDKQYRDELKIATKLDYMYNLKIAVRKDSAPEIISLLDKALATISEDEQHAIFRKWTSVEKVKVIDWEIVIEISVVFMLLLMFMGWHNYKLKKIVGEKTIALDHLANTDPLTGANNRRRLDIDFDCEATRASRYHRKMALLYLDLNNFKSVNDTYGHEQGDKLLKNVALGIMSSLRGSERLYRIGGDEFCVLLPEVSDEKQIQSLARRVDNLIHKIGYRSEPAVDIGCSIGTAMYPQDGDQLHVLMAFADKAMYRQKHKR